MRTETIYDGVSAALNAGAALGAPMTVDDNPFAVVPEGYKLHDLEAFGLQPRRIRQKIPLRSLESFTEYVARFKNDDATTIFADQDNTRLTCVLDYHPNPAEADWCDHVATYNCPL